MAKIEAAFTLQDGHGDFESNKLNVRVVGEGGTLVIYPEGYGEATATKGHGSPVYLELYEGKFRVIIAPDILKEEYKIIDLKKAREDRVKDWD